MRKKKVLVLHGPNLNLLGRREPSVYGTLTMERINRNIVREAKRIDVDVKIHQSNSEGGLIDLIHGAIGKFDAIVINPGGYSHTSVALRDAISASQIPTVEVHLSNIYNREPFRHHSMIAPVSIGQISGFGPNSYLLGLQAVCDHIQSE